MPGTLKNLRSASSQDWSSVISDVVSSFASKETATVSEILTLTEGLVKIFGLTNLTDDNAALVSSGGRPSLTTNDQASKQQNLPESPAVPLAEAVLNDKVVCLCCGEKFSMLKRHLMSEHGLTEAEYRSKYSLPEDMPLVAPSYSARKAEIARASGLGKYSRDT